MHADVDRRQGVIAQPLAVALRDKSLAATLVRLALRQIDFAQTIPGQAGQIVMH